MSSIIQNFNVAWAGLPTSLGQPFSVSGDSEKNYSDAVAPGNLEISLQWGADKLQSIFILSDKPIYVYTNHDAHLTVGQIPTDAYLLTANIPFFWCRSSGIDNPFNDAVPVTRFFIYNPNTSNASVNIKSVINN